MSKRYYLQINNQLPIDITRLGIVVIGRDPNRVTIPIDNLQVSRIQCIIDIQREPFVITDGDGIKKRSKNGTGIGNKVLYGDSKNERERTSLLKNQDIISIGNIKIKFIIEKPEIDSDANVTL